VVIENNYITNANESRKSDEGAISIYPDVSNTRIVNNTLVGNYQGFTVRSKVGMVAPDVHVNFNNIYGNEDFGVGNFAQNGGILDATNNWWGSSTGPCRELPNGKWVGKGDKVSANVAFVPWLPHPIEFWHYLPR